jgi:hypothetical protein
MKLKSVIVHIYGYGAKAEKKSNETKKINETKSLTSIELDNSAGRSCEGM